jgi:predicted XRE-type DNA-binding protein
MLAEGELTQKEIASMFGVSRSAIKDIKTGRTWNHVESTSIT